MVQADEGLVFQRDAKSSREECLDASVWEKDGMTPSSFRNKLTKR